MYKKLFDDLYLIISDYFQSNVYILLFDNKQEFVIIDTGDTSIDFNNVLKELKLNANKCKYIINTHGHYDHIGGNNDIKKITNAELVISKYDESFLTQSNLNLSIMMGADLKSVDADITVGDNDTLEFNNNKLVFIETPGHTSGSICIKYKKYLFTGDTLFYNSVGRTDFPTGNMTVLQKSILKLSDSIEDDTIILPGHMKHGTLSEIKEINPFL